MATRRLSTSAAGASARVATEGDARRRSGTGASARLSPRPTPRPSAGDDGVVVVVAHEALASAAAEWQDRSEHEAAANARLRQRVDELQAALRKALTEVKRRRELPNNEVFTKGLVEENHALAKRNRTLVARLAHYQGRGRDAASRAEASRSAELKPKRPEASCIEQSVQTDPWPCQERTVADDSDAKAALAAVRPLVQSLKNKLRALETDLSRLDQENELLRRELGESAWPNVRGGGAASPAETQPVPVQSQTRGGLQAQVAAQSSLVEILEVRYQRLRETAAQQAQLYQASLATQKELGAKLLEAQQQVGDQQERLAQCFDEHALVEDLRKEVHMLRAENATLGDAVMTLSSRPFDSLSKELQKKNLVIAQLEEEKKASELSRLRADRDACAAYSVAEQARARVKALEAEIQALMSKVNELRVGNERVLMESEVAKLQLRFYTSPPDKELLVALGQAARAIKRKQLGDEKEASSAQGDDSAASA